MRQRWKDVSRFLFCFLFLLLIPRTAAAETEAVSLVPAMIYGDFGITMKAEYGYGGTAKGGRYIPITIELENRNQQPFSGRLQVKTMETDYDIYNYEYPVSINADSASREVYYIPIGYRADQIYVILDNQDGQEVMRQRIKLNINLAVAEFLIGVLSDTPDQLQYLDEVGINYSSLRTKTAVLDARTFPDDEKGLDLLDALLITNYDMRRLNSAQTDAILEWVRKGGVLLLGTGDKARSVLAPFTPEFFDSSVGGPSAISVDMGVEYAANRPGDSYIELSCAEFSMKGGQVILSSDERSILTSVNLEKGTIAAAAYDFADISTFCQEHRSYVEKIFTNLLTEDEISRLSEEIYSGDSNAYWSVQSAINTGNVGKLPNVPVYVIVILIYVVLAGPGLYFYLKKRGLQGYYRTGIVLSAAVFTVLIYVLGIRTRFKDTFFTYAAIKDVSGDTVLESTIINMRNPYNKPYEISLNPDYSIRPITRSYYYDMAAAPLFTGLEEAKVNIRHDTEANTVAVKDVVAFNPQYFQLDSRRENTEHEGISGDITVFDGSVFGSVTNHFTDPIENAAILLPGQIVLAGRLEPGETKALDNRGLLNVPMGNSYITAEKITGSDQYQKADISDKNYLKALERTNVLMYYLENYRSSHHSDARIIGFSTEKEESGFLMDDSYETYGSTLLTSSVDVKYTRNGQTYRSGFLKLPEVTSGNYNASGNSMLGTEPVVLEYSLGNDLEVDKVTFTNISDSLLQNEKYNYLTVFAGNMYFYNYNTGTYDLMKQGQRVYDSKSLKPYLSPSNTLTVKYVPDHVKENTFSSMLPLLTIVGREK